MKLAFALEQTVIFLWAIAVGAGIMLCYDLFRMLRTAFPVSDGVIFAEDVCFFVIAGMITWFYLLESCRGELRGFVMIGEGIGGLIYFLTIGRLVMGIAKPIIHFLQRFINRLIIRPVQWIWKTIKSIFKWLIRLCKTILNWLGEISGIKKIRKILRNKKKIRENTKIHLQERHSLLYNLYVIFLSWTKHGKPSQVGNQLQEVDKNEQIPDPNPDAQTSGR